MTMRDRLSSPTATWISRGVLAAVFLLYGASKIPYPAEFAENVHNYRLAPVPVENLMAMTLPWIEVAAALALLYRPWVLGGTLVIGGLTVVFIAVIATAIARGLDISCGCFGVGTGAAYDDLRQHIVLDAILLVLALHLWWAELYAAWKGRTRERLFSTEEGRPTMQPRSTRRRRASE